MSTSASNTTGGVHCIVLPTCAPNPTTLSQLYLLDQPRYTGSPTSALFSQVVRVASRHAHPHPTPRDPARACGVTRCGVTEGGDVQCVIDGAAQKGRYSAGWYSVCRNSNAAVSTETCTISYPLWLHHTEGCTEGAVRRELAFRVSKAGAQRGLYGGVGTQKCVTAGCTEGAVHRGFAEALWVC